MIRYEHRQIGEATLVLLIMLIVILGFIYREANAPTMLIPMAVLTLAALIFGQMTVRVTDAGVRWWFGFGWPGGEVSLADVADAQIVKTSMLEGRGIHLTWHGWLWNTSGFSAVQLKRRDGVPITLGTDQPEALLAAIEAAGPGT